MAVYRENETNTKYTAAGTTLQLLGSYRLYLILTAVSCLQKLSAWTAVTALCVCLCASEPARSKLVAIIQKR